MRLGARGAFLLPGTILEKLEHAMDHDDYDELRKGVIKALGRAGGMPVGGGAPAPAMPLGWVTRLLPEHDSWTLEEARRYTPKIRVYAWQIFKTFCSRCCAQCPARNASI
jgi:hypothetical protein